MNMIGGLLHFHLCVFICSLLKILLYLAVLLVFIQVKHKKPIPS
jgi:hypothetical protein